MLCDHDFRCPIWNVKEFKLNDCRTHSFHKHVLSVYHECGAESGPVQVRGERRGNQIRVVGGNRHQQHHRTRERVAQLG